MKAAIRGENESAWTVLEVRDEAGARRAASARFNGRYTVDADEVAQIEEHQADTDAAMN